MPNTAPKILVIKEKHGESTYLIESVDDFARVAASVVLDRAKTGYYYPTVDHVRRDKEVSLRNLNARFSDAERVFVDMTDSDVEALPASLAEIAGDVRKKYREAVQQVEDSYAKDAKFAELVVKLKEAEFPHQAVVRVGGQAYRLASYLLDCRAEHEYEGYEFERLSAIPTDDEIQELR